MTSSEMILSDDIMCLIDELTHIDLLVKDGDKVEALEELQCLSGSIQSIIDDHKR